MRGVDQQEQQQPDRQREQHVETGRAEPLHQRKPHQPQGDGNHADVETNQRKGKDLPRFDLRRFHRDGDLVLEHRSGRRDHPDEVRFTLHPRIGDVETGAAKVAKLRAVLLGGERPVRIVHGHLRDGDRVGAVVEHREPDAVWCQHCPLDDQPLDRRGPFGLDEPERAGSHQHEQQHGEQRERDDGEHPDAAR